MARVMRRLLDFVLNMEAARWRTLAAGVLLLGAMAGLLLAGKTMLGLDAEHRMEAWLQGYAGSPMAFVATVILFIAAAFVGAPQFILIAAQDGQHAAQHLRIALLIDQALPFGTQHGNGLGFFQHQATDVGFVVRIGVLSEDRGSSDHRLVVLS